MIPAPGRVVERVVLQNRDDPRREFREIVLYPHGGSLFHGLGISRVCLGLSGQDRISTTNWLQVRDATVSEIRGGTLCDEEGFTIVK